MEIDKTSQSGASFKKTSRIASHATLEESDPLKESGTTMHFFIRAFTSPFLIKTPVRE